MILDPYPTSDGYDSDCDSDADSVLDIEDEDAADAYVARVFAMATDEERERMRRTHLRSVIQFVEVTANPFGRTPKNMSGGMDPRFTELDFRTKELDFRVHKLLEFADSLHDFPADAHADVVEKVLHIDENDYPVVTRTDKFGNNTTVRMTIADVVTHRQFLTDLTSNRVLIFGNEEVDSPLHGLDYRPEMLTHPSSKVPVEDREMTRKEYQEALIGAQKVHDDRTPQSDLFKCKEVWSEQDDKSRKMQVLKLQQIIDVCNCMREKFKNDSCFVMDTNGPLPRMVSSYALIDKSVNKKFRIENDAAEDLVPLLQEIVSKSWENVTCDASLIDAADHRGVVHRRATGDVFHPDSLVQVTLDGCDGFDVYRYKASSETVTDDSRGTPEMNVPKTVTRDMWLHLREKYSKATVIGLLEQSSVKVDGEFVPKPIEEIQHVARWLALKRAGDWGQVLHCKKYGLVFMTGDKPAFMFAVALDVPAMLFVENDDDHVKDKKMKLSTFVMYSGTRSRSELTNKEALIAAEVDDSPKEYGQVGGRGHGYGLAIACAAVTIAASL